MKIYKILLLLVLNLFIQFNSLAQDVCNGQSKQEKEYQTFCGKDTCFRSTAFGGKCEPATEKKRLEIALEEEEALKKKADIEKNDETESAKKIALEKEYQEYLKEQRKKSKTNSALEDSLKANDKANILESQNKNECIMHIKVTNTTSDAIEVGLAIAYSKNIISKLKLQGNSEDKFSDLCKNRYVVVIKNREEYTETQIIDIRYDISIDGNKKQTSWTNGTADYFKTSGFGSNAKRIPKDKYKF